MIWSQMRYRCAIGPHKLYIFNSLYIPKIKAEKYSYHSELQRGDFDFVQ